MDETSYAGSVPLNSERRPPYKVAGLALILVVVTALTLVFFQFRGDLTPVERLTVMTARAGLVMDPGSKVTYRGVTIGRVAQIQQVDVDGTPKAKLSLNIDPKYIKVIPANAGANIIASTVFGNKYVAITPPKAPSLQRITPNSVIDVSSTTTEFNTLFESITSISEKVDPIKLNSTLSALAEALTGLGAKFGQSLVDGNRILEDLNPQLPRLQYGTQRLADLADIYAQSAPDLLDFLDNAVVTAHTISTHQRDVDAALLAAIGLGNNGAGLFTDAGPYLVRGQADLVPTAQLLDKYSPALLCTIRNIHDIAPKVSETFGGNGFSLETNSQILGGENAYVYPDNLPRVNARGGPNGAPGCWQPITRDLWPAPWLVTDTGASVAPYNHFELGQPIAIDYIWGRQIGENTINP